MIEREQCINCRYYRPEPHAGWKQPSWSPVYDVQDLRNYLGEVTDWKAGWPGECRAEPKPVAVRSIYGCGRWAVNLSFVRDWDGLTDIQWYRKRAKEAERALKAAQQLALERYRRLKKERAAHERQIHATRPPRLPPGGPGEAAPDAGPAEGPWHAGEP